MVEDLGRSLPTLLTRDQLYEQVWTTPIASLAEQFGIKAESLERICKRLRVPYPSRRHWEGLAVGEQVPAHALPSATDTTRRYVMIRSSRTRDAKHNAQGRLEAARTLVGAVAVRARLARPHRIIAGWLADRNQRKQRARQEVNAWMKEIYDPGVLSEMDRRRHRILDALFKSLERHRAAISEEKRGRLFAEIDGEKIEFQLREKSTQTRRPLSHNEMRVRSYVERGWRKELRPTGKLLFAIKTRLPDGLRTEWLETDDNPMEALLLDIVATFIVASDRLVERTQRRAEANDLYEAARQRQHEEQQRQDLDDARWRRAVEIAQLCREADLVRALLGALKAVGTDGSKDVAGLPLHAWIDWLDRRVDATDPRTWAPEDVFTSIGSVVPETFRR